MNDPLSQALNSAGLSHRAAEIEHMALPSIRLTTQGMDEKKLAVGTSKFGGSPDLPPEYAWPERNGFPLPFVAQINLSDVASYETEHILPSEGIISFFFDMNQFFEVWPPLSATWRVLFQNRPISSLQRFTLPRELSKMRKYQPCAVAFSYEITLPDYSQYDPVSVERLGLSTPLTNEEELAYFRVQAQLEGTAEITHHTPIHRLLGHPNPVQWDMLRELPAEPAGWTLLLQLDSDSVPNTEWGDTGRIYYWMPTEDLHRLDFSHVCLILQSS